MATHRKPDTYSCAGLHDEYAYTKSEARALFKVQMQRIANDTSFRPARITRLPVGVKVVKR